MARVDRRPRKRLSPTQRRSAILSAAREAFAAAAYDQVSLAGIADAADASEALVHRYFATKGELYVEVVRSSIDTLLERQRAADEAAGGDTADRWQRVVTSIEVYLDFVSDAAQGWVAPLRSPHGSFQAAANVHTEATAGYVQLLRELLNLEPGAPRDQALHGYIGFLDAACMSWVDAGADPDGRAAVITMALGALSGALAALDSID